LLALPVAYYLHSGAPGGRIAAIGWNVLRPRRFRSRDRLPERARTLPNDCRRHQTASLGTYPTVMIPAFAVPRSVILHGLLLWQLKRLGRNTGSPSGVKIEYAAGA